jgi:hypothetical protein
MISEKKYKTRLLERKSLISLLGVLVIFVVSRVLYDWAGIRFQGDTYLGYWQFIDPALLRTDLWRSVFYLHSQPPLTNLFTGIVLQVFPTDHGEVFHISYFIIGIILGISIYLTGISLRFPHWLSAFVSALFMVSPGTVFYEHWLMYAYPLTAALTLSGFCLYQFICTNKNYWGLIFFTLLSGVALTWSLFHIIWLFGVAVILFIVLAERRKVVLVAFLPLLLVTAWYTKNLLTVGEFTASSWAGMNLSKIATFRVSEKERAQMVKSGELSKFALLPPFRNPLVYLKLLPDTPLTGIPLLDEPQTSLNGRNHHHLVYVEASKYYLRDALHVIRAKPIDYLRSVNQAIYIYFHSSSDFDLTTGNRDHVSAFDLWWNRLFFGQWKNDETSADRNSGMSMEHVGWWIVVSFVVAGVGSAIFLWKNRRHLFEPQNLLILFMAYNIFFATVVGNLMDIGENNRFRFTIDPFVLVLFIFFARNMLSSFTRRIPNKDGTIGTNPSLY